MATQGFDAPSACEQPDLLAGIHNYSEDMTVSQVVKFFERQGVAFTKTMIQNYVRIGLLPSPDRKRFYNRRHLMMLAMIHSLKEVLSLDEIKALFGMVAGNGGDLEKMAFAYESFLSVSAEAVEKTKIFKKNENNDKFCNALLFASLSLITKKMAQSLL